MRQKTFEIHIRVSIIDVVTNILFRLVKTYKNKNSSKDLLINAYPNVIYIAREYSYFRTKHIYKDSIPFIFLCFI